jgi:hypothetical protein
MKQSELANEPYRTFLPASVAVGLACLGAYWLAEASYRRV